MGLGSSSRLPLKMPRSTPSPPVTCQKSRDFSSSDHILSDFVTNCGLHAFEPMSPRTAHRTGRQTMLSVMGFFSVASAASLLPFGPACLSSVSEPCPYPSYLCLPLRTSFSRWPASFRREDGCVVSSVSAYFHEYTCLDNNDYLVPLSHVAGRKSSPLFRRSPRQRQRGRAG